MRDQIGIGAVLNTSFNLHGFPLVCTPKEAIDRISQRARDGGAEIVSLLKTSAWYAPGAAIVEMVDAIIHDRKKILPCAAYLEGEYGINGLFVGVPVKLGERGIEQVIEINLTLEERAALQKSAAAVKELTEKVVVHGLAHITGGGAFLKLERVIGQAGLGAELDELPTPPEIFQLIKRAGRVQDTEMYRTFNMGVGLVVICPETQSERGIRAFHKRRQDATRIGRVEREPGIRIKGEPLN